MTTENTNNPKSLIEQKLKILEYSLENNDNWYDGSAVRDLLNTNIFSSKNPSTPENTRLSSTGWPAYCHYSNKSAFINMLDLHRINEKSKVLIHPLLPSELIDTIISRGATVICSDIDIATLAFDKNTYQSILQNEKETPDLVIHFCDNGVYIPVQELVDFTKKIGLPSMIVLNSQTATQDLINLMYSNTTRSILWNTSSYFEDPILCTMTKKPLNQPNWTISWFLASNSNLPQNNLKNDKTLYKLVLSSFYTELLAKYREFGLQTIFYTFKHKTARKIKKYDKVAGDKNILESIENIILSAIPNFVFQIKKTDGLNFGQKLEFNEMNILSNNIKTQAKSLDEMITGDIKKFDKKGDESIHLNENHTYLKYFFYTNDKQFWADWAFKKNLKIYELQPLHSIFTDTKLPNATMVSNKIVYFDTVDYLV
jgi:hypothetical protein